MAFDEGLAQRLREQLPGADEKRMFGGVAFMQHGNLVVGVLGDDLIARVGPAATEEALAAEATRPFDFTGRPMNGWVVVGGDALEEDEDLAAWVERCRRFVETLPEK